MLIFGGNPWLRTVHLDELRASSGALGRVGLLGGREEGPNTTNDTVNEATDAATYP